MGETWPRWRPTRAAAPPSGWRAPPLGCRATRPSSRSLAPGSRGLWFSWPSVDAEPSRRGPAASVRRLLPPCACRPVAQGDALEPAKAGSARPPARRRGHCPLAPGDVAGHQQGAQTQGQRIFSIDASGFSPLPSVVRTYAPVGHTPILKEWWTREHLSAISAISPEGKLSCHCQDRARDSVDVVAFPEHLLREVPGRMVSIWDGAPVHRSQVIKTFLGNGAAPRLHVERLPA